MALLEYMGLVSRNVALKSSIQVITHATLLYRTFSLGPFNPLLLIRASMKLQQLPCILPRPRMHKEDKAALQSLRHRVRAQTRHPS